MRSQTPPDAPQLAGFNMISTVAYNINSKYLQDIFLGARACSRSSRNESKLGKSAFGQDLQDRKDTILVKNPVNPFDQVYKINVSLNMSVSFIYKQNIYLYIYKYIYT
jgi:hypothetical protein